MTRTIEDMAEEVDSLRKEVRRLNNAITAAHKAADGAKSLDMDKYARGYRLGVQEGAERVAQAVANAMVQP